MGSETYIAAADRKPRSKPRPWQTDWLVLRKLAETVQVATNEIVTQGAKVLDFGCGDQPYRLMFEERGAIYHGADFGTGADIAIGADGFVAAPEDSADIVASFQVLEHVRNLDLYLAEAARILRPDGELILSTHGTWLFHPHPEDHRRWTRMGLIGELEARGWCVTRCTALVGPLAFTTLIRLTGFNHALRRLPVAGRFMGAMLALAMNARALIEDIVTPSIIRDDNACVYVVRAHRKNR